MTAAWTARALIRMRMSMSTRFRRMRRPTRSSFRTRICSSPATSSAPASTSSSPSDDRELVLHDYFKGEKRARAGLARWRPSHRRHRRCADRPRPVGAGRRQRRARPRSSVMSPSWSGTATAIRNGVSIILQPGRQRQQGRRGPVRLRFDARHHLHRRQVFGLASNAQMVLNEMVYDPNGSNNSSLISLVQGTISFVAGADRQAWRHEGRHAGRDHGHPRHRGADRDRLRGARPGRCSRRRNSRCWSSPTAPPAPTSCSTRPR